MEHILIQDHLGKSIVSRLDPQCITNCFGHAGEVSEKCRVVGSGTRRRCKKSNSVGTVFLCTDDPDLLTSSRQFQHRINTYMEMLASFRELKEEAIKKTQAENRRLVHNLTTLNSHVLQEIYSIIPQEKLTGDPQGQISLIRNALADDTEKAASAALRILKNAVAARTEMQIIRWLQPTENPPALSQKQHALHKVVKNALITFFQDSIEKKLDWQLGFCKNQVLFDYQTISAALYRLFENATKYCRENTVVWIKFPMVGKIQELAIEMESLWISDLEKDLIFNEGYSGEMARKHELHGDGLGLYFVKEMLRLNSASIRFESIIEGNPLIDGKYGQNRFVITFARGSTSI